MHVSHYIMRDQTRDKVTDIMRDPPAATLVTRPSWVALVLLVAAFNVIAITSA